MKVVWIAIFGVIIALFYFISKPTAPPPEAALPISAPFTALTATPSASPLVQPPIAEMKVQAPTQERPPYSVKPKNMVVEFKVVDGLAVAYGDVVIGKPSKDFSGSGGLTEIPRPLLWKRGEIPYAVQSDVVRPERVEAAIQLFHSRTGLKFVPYSGQEDAIVFTQGKEHCTSFLGRIGGLQPIFLSEECSPENIAHEIMHALGFVHEQSRTDRDQFVTILWQNIDPKYQSQFAMIPDSLMEVYGGSPFDPTSILMYDPHAFTLDPKAETMKLKDGGEIKAAPFGLSDVDVERVNRLYRN